MLAFFYKDVNKACFISFKLCVELKTYIHWLYKYKQFFAKASNLDGPRREEESLVIPAGVSPSEYTPATLNKSLCGAECPLALRGFL